MSILGCVELVIDVPSGAAAAVIVQVQFNEIPGAGSRNNVKLICIVLGIFLGCRCVEGYGAIDCAIVIMLRFQKSPLTVTVSPTLTLTSVPNVPV